MGYQQLILSRRRARKKGEDHKMFNALLVSIVNRSNCRITHWNNEFLR